MSTRCLALLLAVLSLTATLTATPATAAAGHLPLLVARRGGEAGMSLNEAVRQVQRETGGRVLSADTVSQGGRTVHRIKVLTPAGQVRVVTIDAQSGARR